MALKANKSLGEQTVADEFAELLEEAKGLPADDIIYSRGDIKMKHRPATRVRSESVYVMRYDTIRRCIKVNGKWSRSDQPAAFSEFAEEPQS